MSQNIIKRIITKTDNLKKLLERWWPKRWVLTGTVVAAILYLTLTSKPLPDGLLPPLWFIGYLAHCCMFGGLTLVASGDYAWRGNRFADVSAASLWAIAALSTLLGVATEVAQGLMAIGRSFDLLDMVADATGSAVAALLILLSRR